MAVELFAMWMLTWKMENSRQTLDDDVDDDVDDEDDDDLWCDDDDNVNDKGQKPARIPSNRLFDFVIRLLNERLRSLAHTDYNTNISS